MTSLRLNQNELQSNLENSSTSFYSTYPNLFQLCASSDIQEGYDVDKKPYMFQNYTVAILFQKQKRFRMNEYQVKWTPNTDRYTMASNPYNVQILLIKVRDIILKVQDDSTSIKRYMIYPLYEKMKTLSKG